MKVKVLKPCFHGGSLRRVGDVVEFSGAKLPAYFEQVGEERDSEPVIHVRKKREK